MASLLDFLNYGGGNGILGGIAAPSLKTAFGADEAQAAREAAAATLARRMRRGGITEPAPDQLAPFAQQPGSLLDPFNGGAGAAGLNLGSFGLPTPQAAPAAPVQPPMRVSLPLDNGPPNPAPAPAPIAFDPFNGRNAIAAQPQAPAPVAPPLPAPVPAAQPSFLQQLGANLRDNSATLMALGGGIAQHGAGGFAAAAPIALQEQAISQANANQAITAKSISDALINKGWNQQQAMGIGWAAATNKDVAHALLPDLLGVEKPSGSIKIGKLDLPIRQVNGVATLMLPGGKNAAGLNDLVSLSNQLTQQEAAAQAEGTKMGAAATSIPQARVAAEDALKGADELLGHPGRPSGTLPGAVGYGLYRWIPTTDAAGFDKRFAQLNSGAFLEAYNMLRGGGQISNAEGAQAKQAMLRASAATNAKEFNEAIADFKDHIRKGFAALQNTARGNFNTNAPLATPLPAGWSVQRVQ